MSFTSNYTKVSASCKNREGKDRTVYPGALRAAVRAWIKGYTAICRLNRSWSTVEVLRQHIFWDGRCKRTLKRLIVELLRWGTVVMSRGTVNPLHGKTYSAFLQQGKGLSAETGAAHALISCFQMLFEAAYIWIYTQLSMGDNTCWKLSFIHNSRNYSR